jgi:hypothetical protein
VVCGRLVLVLNEIEIRPWKEMKECMRTIIWLEIWHDRVGEQVWEGVSRKLQDAEDFLG